MLRITDMAFMIIQVAFDFAVSFLIAGMLHDYEWMHRDISNIYYELTMHRKEDSHDQV